MVYLVKSGSSSGDYVVLYYTTSDTNIATYEAYVKKQMLTEELKEMIEVLQTYKAVVIKQGVCSVCGASQ